MSGEVHEVRRALTDARALCRALGLLEGVKPQKAGHGGVLVRCPSCQGGSSSPPCSVSLGPDGTLRARCFSCSFTGDVLTLIAVSLGLDLRADFRAVLGEAARLAGVDLADERPAGGPRPEAPYAAPSYPDAGEVAALWSSACAVTDDGEAADYLASRAIDPDMVALYDLARVLPRGASTPAWARCRGRRWSDLHRLILPVFDAAGAMPSLRAWRLPGVACDDDTPKRTAPAGKASAGLVLACPVARQVLATGQAPSWASARAPLDVVVAEGEPDFLSWCSRVSDADEHPPAIVGVVAGGWTLATAARIPDGSRVILRTDDDAAGDRYAREVKASLEGRAVQVFDRKRGARGQAA